MRAASYFGSGPLSPSFNGPARDLLPHTLEHFDVDQGGVRVIDDDQTVAAAPPG